MNLPGWTNNSLLAGLVVANVGFVALALAKQMSWSVVFLVVGPSVLIVLLLCYWPRIIEATKDKSKGFREIALRTLNLIWHPYLRFVYFLVLLVLIVSVSRVPSRYYFAIGILFLYVIQGVLKKELIFTPASLLFSDEFKNLDGWKVITGDAAIESNFGNPQPDVILRKGNGRTNSFISVKKIVDLQDGSIECDVYLEPNSLVNVVFRGNLNNGKYYMARLDSRSGSLDCILRLDGNNDNWKVIAASNQRSEPKSWYHLKVVLKEKKIWFYKNENLIISTTDTAYSGGEVGIFNELRDVHIDNFIVRKEK
jgi:hypothetical protein